MFRICVDENGYYKEGNDGRLVEVGDIPGGVELTLYKYDEESKTLVLSGEEVVQK